MTTALLRLGLAFCDDVDRLAPLTRNKKSRAVDLTAANLGVKADRLRGLLKRVFGDDGVPVIGGWDDPDQYVAAILVEAEQWRERSKPSEAAAAQLRLVAESGELLRALLRKNDAAAARTA